MKKFLFLIIMVQIMGPAFAGALKKSVSVSVDYTIEIPKNLSLEEAKREVLLKGKLDCIAKQFGVKPNTDLSQLTEDNVEGHWDTESESEPIFTLYNYDGKSYINVKLTGKVYPLNPTEKK